MNPTQEQLEALWVVCRKFVDDNDISCAEPIYQCDRVIEGAYEFIEKICETIGYAEYREDE